MRLNKQTATVSAGQLREIAKAVSQMIAVTVAEKPKQLLALLNHYGLSVNGSASEKEIIEAVIDKVAEKDQAFNKDLERIILLAFPDLSPNSQYDNFGEEPQLFGGASRIFGGSGGFKGFGGGSSGSKLVDGAKSIGTSTASGAAGGGIVGAALGAIGGIFGLANSAKQEQMEKSKASAMTLSSMLQYKAAKLGSKGSSQRTMTAIVISIIALIGISITVVLIMKNKKAKQWEVATA